MSTPARTRVAVVGAGVITDTHLAALRALDAMVEIVAVCDVNASAAESAKAKFGIPAATTDTEELIERIRPDVVHVNVPPTLHAAVAEPYLRAGIHVLMEKPFATTVEECDTILAAAKAGGARVGVNHNATFAPTFLRLQKIIESGELGRVNHVQSLVNIPARQLIMNQYGHWMFDRPGNVLFELGSHPMSQIRALCGRALTIESLPTGYRSLTPERDMYENWLVSLECEKATAQLYFSCAREFVIGRVQVFCQDGVAMIDLLNNSLVVRGRTKYPQFYDSYKSNKGVAKMARATARRNLKDFVLSTLKLKSRQDTFYLGMLESLRAFYTALRDGAPLPRDGQEGRDVIEMCDRATRVPSKRTKTAARPAQPEPREGETAIIGATGFMGRYLFERLKADGHKLRVVCRRPDAVPHYLADPDVRTVHGDVGDRASLIEAFEGCRFVYNLAGAVGETMEENRRLITESTENVAEACLATGVERLFWTSTIATYYLGDHGSVKEDTPLDPKIGERAFYARAKAEAEELLWRLHREKGLDMMIFRPGVVVGRGGRPNHSAIGVWNNPTNAIAWGRGDQPQPLVLADDCAVALANAAKLGDDPKLRSFNLVGDVRLTAREYCDELSKAWNRKVRLFPLATWRAFGIDVIKWIVKKLTRRPNSTWPSYRDLKTREQNTRFDTTGTKDVLGWQPCADRDEFVRRGIAYDNEPPEEPGKTQPTRELQPVR